MKDSSIHIDAERRDGTGLIRLEGRLIVGHVRELENSIDDLVGQGVKNLVLNLSGVTHIGSSGLGLLMTLHNRFLNAGGAMLIANPSKQCQESLALTRMDEIFRVVDSEDEALRQLR